MIKSLHVFLLLLCCSSFVVKSQDRHIPPAPLFRDPIYDGAADPVVIWNDIEKAWWMLYTQRRANVDAMNVAYCYGSAIGIAASKDNGHTWIYRGALNLEFEKGMNTFWAPDVVFNNGTYHMFVSYIQGVRNNWGGNARIAHYTSKDMWDWKFEGFPELSSEKVIDPTLIQMQDKKWRVWYKDEARGSHIMMAESNDLFKWTFNTEPAIGERAQEGPKVFHFKDWYWMVTDEWKGMRVYRSKDMLTWTKQGMILDVPGKRPEDIPTGAHGDVVVVDDKAYVIYFTHPGRKFHGEDKVNEDGIVPYSRRRSSIQVAELKFENGTLVCDRDAPFDFWLPAK
ncbi:Glycosyl hydrolases family 43 [Chitinophaga sp. CF118]|uniref:family 43 glycosylhydrolase n=1 Tax=Chitinophaga sp. CF118 TaxID=1884367 RepID=UPI0008E3CA2D|nr:family 43 glycosylhydrolase [Chitinophaga sp. CF118]SFF01185.1 Glycosyl hydrolases family 43 [Chitinophaga sp. CF118]